MKNVKFDEKMKNKIINHLYSIYSKYDKYLKCINFKFIDELNLDNYKKINPEIVYAIKAKNKVLYDLYKYAQYDLDLFINLVKDYTSITKFIMRKLDYLVDNNEIENIIIESFDTFDGNGIFYLNLYNSCKNYKNKQIRK